MINALAFVVVVFLVAWFGLRPMVARRRQAGGTAGAELRRGAALAADAGSGGDGHRRPERGGCRRGRGARQRSNAIDDLRQKIRPAPQDRLARMVDLNEERTAQILRKWAAVTAEASLMPGARALRRPAGFRQPRRAPHRPRRRPSPSLSSRRCRPTPAVDVGSAGLPRRSPRPRPPSPTSSRRSTRRRCRPSATTMPAERDQLSRSLGSEAARADRSALRRNAGAARRR